MTINDYFFEKKNNLLKYSEHIYIIFFYCTDTFKSPEDDKIPLTPSIADFEHDKSKYTEIKKISCPTDFTGLLPHPETCKKFLQCANGATFVMDCGPGTAFNPLTTVCDWPYNVPSCKTGNSIITHCFKQITVIKYGNSFL